MLTGFKGIKYGLQQPVRPSAKQPAKPIAAFADDEPEEDRHEVGRAIARQAAVKRTDKKVHAAALAEDASVFDYDGVYDSLQEQKVQPRQAEKLARNSRYIQGLLEKAKERQKEQDIVYERKLAKEREAEDHLFGDKDRFVTAAYKRKLEEDKLWLAQEKVREAREAKQDVVKAGHMGNFYRNVMKDNVAFGTAKAETPLPVRGEKADAAGPSTSSAAQMETVAKAAQDPAWQAARAARAAFEEAQVQDEPLPSSAGRGSGGPVAPVRRADGAAEAVGSAERPEALSSAAADPPGKERGGGGDPGTEQTAAPDMAAAAPAPKPVVSEPVMSKEDRAAAARERYLARKRKATEPA